MSTVSTHVLDLVRGGPAAGVAVTLERQAVDGWETVGRAVTDPDGRVRELARDAGPGTWRVHFDTGAWFAARGTPGFYPWITIVFTIDDAGGHYHVPVLLGPYGYSTYRGS